MSKKAKTKFGQLVIGPPGSGKTTYVAAMADLLTSLGRSVSIINLDPANESVSYTPAVDVSDLVGLDEVMSTLHLGPNGGLVYCMEFLAKNYSWLEERIDALGDTYLLVDCPGQVELYTANNAVKEIVANMVKADIRLAAVHLVDSHYCSDPGKFISVCLTSLTTMLQVELPHINLLSKVDMVEKYGKLQFNLDYYTDVLDLDYLLEALPDDPFTKKYRLLNTALTGLITDYSLVNFVPITVKSKERMLAVSQLVDKANGYIFGSGEERSIRNMAGSAFGGADFEDAKIGDIREKYMDTGGEELLGNDLDKVDLTDPQFQV